MKKIIVTTLIATAFIFLLLSANVKPQERGLQSVPTTTTAPPITEHTTAITTPKNGTIEGDLIWIQGFGWIEYGGGGIGYYDAGIYTNGNKIGYFG